MLTVVMPGQEPDQPLSQAMFAARKSVFVDLLGWNVPVIEGKYEVDQFDTPSARYLIIADDGRHAASARLLPTTQTGILSGLFPMLCESACPAGEAVFEITRFCLDRKLRAGTRRAARDALVCALADYALMAGIRSYCAVAETSWFRQILRFGWKCRALGPAMSIAGEDLVALEIDIDSDTPRLLARAGIMAARPHAHAARFAA